MCPGCGAGARPRRALLPDCGLPLVHAPGIADEPKADRARERARKVQPGYAEGPLVRVAAARHQAEAELVQGMLLEEGIPSLARRSGGFDVPDFLASGPRDILVALLGRGRGARPAGPRPPAARLVGLAAVRRARPRWVRVLGHRRWRLVLDRLGDRGRC